jgi:hypothetical protein
LIWPTIFERGTGSGRRWRRYSHTIAKANATTYWQKANDHADKLDRKTMTERASDPLDELFE